MQEQVLFCEDNIPLPALTATWTRGEPRSGKYSLGFSVTHSHRSRRRLSETVNDCMRGAQSDTQARTMREGESQSTEGATARRNKFLSSYIAANHECGTCL